MIMNALSNVSTSANPEQDSFTVAFASLSDVKVRDMNGLMNDRSCGNSPHLCPPLIGRMPYAE